MDTYCFRQWRTESKVYAQRKVEGQNAANAMAVDISRTALGTMREEGILRFRGHQPHQQILSRRGTVMGLPKVGSWEKGREGPLFGTQCFHLPAPTSGGKMCGRS